jgi:2-hydroxychromene-2-carboxylate isomerase
MNSATIYYDLGSPYAHLAVARGAEVFGFEPCLQPILVGGIFAERGWGSWAHTAAREGRIEEIEARANRYGLPLLSWPENWPNNTLKAMRAAIWADSLGHGPRFAHAGFHRAFTEGADLSQLDVLVDLARALGLPADELPDAIEEPAVKDGLRRATTEAWEHGVTGVPSIEANGKVFFGDDSLELAAESAG